MGNQPDASVSSSSDPGPSLMLEPLRLTTKLVNIRSAACLPTSRRWSLRRQAAFVERHTSQLLSDADWSSTNAMLCDRQTVEEKLADSFHKFAAVTPTDWQRSGEMVLLAQEIWGLRILPPQLPPQAEDQGATLLVLAALYLRPSIRP